MLPTVIVSIMREKPFSSDNPAWATWSICCRCGVYGGRRCDGDRMHHWRWTIGCQHLVRCEHFGPDIDLGWRRVRLQIVGVERAVSCFAKDGSRRMGFTDSRFVRRQQQHGEKMQLATAPAEIHHGQKSNSVNRRRPQPTLRIMRGRKVAPALRHL